MAAGKLNIAMVVYRYPVLSETFIDIQINELIRRGHAVELIEINPVTFRRIGTVLRLMYLLVTGTISLSSLIDFITKYRSDITSITRILYGFLRMKSCDIIHCQFATLGWHIINMKDLGYIKPEVKFVCSVRGSDITSKKYQKRFLWERLLDHVDLFLPVCVSFKDELLEMGRESGIKIVYSPVNITRMDETLKRNGVEGNGEVSYDHASDILKIISVGRLVEKKGFSDAIMAAKLLKEQGLKFHYTIIGGGEEKDNLIHLIKSYNLYEHVSLMGALPHAEVIAQLSRHHVLIAPSKVAQDGNSEGIPNILKEGMYMGLQVVGTNHSGIPELITDEVNGYLCEEGMPEEICKIVLKIAASTEKWDDVARRAKEKVSTHYSPQTTNETLEAAYHSVIDQTTT